MASTATTNLLDLPHEVLIQILSFAIAGKLTRIFPQGNAAVTMYYTIISNLATCSRFYDLFDEAYFNWNYLYATLVAWSSRVHGGTLHVSQLTEATFLQHPLLLANVRHLYLFVDVQQLRDLRNTADEIEQLVSGCGRLLSLTLNVAGTAINLQLPAFEEMSNMGHAISGTRERYVRTMGEGTWLGLADLNEHIDAEPEEDV